MKHFTTNGREWVAVKVEDKSINHVVKSTSIGKPNQLCYDVVWVAGIYITNQRIVVLPEGEWDVFGLLSQIQNDEGKCEELVLHRIDQTSFPTSMEHYDYMSNNMVHLSFNFETAIESFHSLQQSLKMFTVNPYGEVPNQGEEDEETFWTQANLWQSVQQHVSEYLILEKIK